MESIDLHWRSFEQSYALFRQQETLVKAGRSTIHLILLACAAASVLQCAPKKSNSRKDSETPARKELAAKDVAGFNFLSSSTLAQYNAKNNNVIEAIFGGTTGSHIANYFSERISYFLSVEDLRAMGMNTKGFQFDDPKKRLAAANIGTLFWLNSLASGRVMRIQVGDRIIPITSSRVGLLMLGSGYMGSQILNGESVPIPSTLRQAILVHEARHSDCTGGLNRSQLQTWENGDESLECGHTHAVCPSGSFKGIAACDDRPWGAYAIGVIYAKALLPLLSGTDRQLLEHFIVDQGSRLVGVDLNQMIAGRYNRPNMTSSGFR